MKLHILVEGAADMRFLETWLPRLIPNHTFAIYPHQGKGKLPTNPNLAVHPRRRGLLDQLPGKLRAFGRSLKADTDRVFVLVDCDEQDCVDLKTRLIAILDSCDPAPETKFRIAIRETEAFFLGDLPAIKKAYPKSKSKFILPLEPDEIEDPAETIAKIVGSTSERKIEWAEMIGRQLTLSWHQNKSSSFRTLCQGLLTHCGEKLPSAKTSTSAPPTRASMFPRSSASAASNNARACFRSPGVAPLFSQVIA